MGRAWEWQLDQGPIQLWSLWVACAQKSQLASGFSLLGGENLIFSEAAVGFKHGDVWESAL